MKNDKNTAHNTHFPDKNKILIIIRTANNLANIHCMQILEEYIINLSESNSS